MQSVSVTSDRNLADRRIPKTQGRMDSLQEKTREGRGIQQEQAVIPSLNKMTVKMHTPRQPISNYTASKDSSGGVRERVCIRKKKPPAMTLSESVLSEVNDNCAAGVTKTFRDSVDVFFKKFQKSQRENLDALRLCLMVSKEIWRVLKYSAPISDDDMCYMKASLGKLYTDNLYPALQILQDKITSGRSWEYVNELNRLAERFSSFFIQGDPDRAMCRSMIERVYYRFLCNEVDYLNYIIHSPLAYSVESVVSVMNLILDSNKPASCFGFLTEQEANIFRGEQMNLLMRVNSNLNDKGVDKKKQNSW